MRTTILAALIGSAFAAGSAHAGLVLDLNGSAAGGQITADALDWAPTSFLAQGGNSAIAAFAASGGSCAAVAGINPCQFDVLTHAKLTAYAPTGTNTFMGLPAFGGEITMIARYTERVVDFAVSMATGRPRAEFESTGAGYVEFYFSADDSNSLTGGGFDNGRLIGRLDGVTIGSVGSFTVTDLTPTPLDGTSDGNDYDGQQTVTGFGSQSNLRAGRTGVALDPTFFLTTLAGFSLQYENISIGLPYTSVNPSDCFTPGARGAAAVGTSGFASTCDSTHVDGLYAVQGNASGYTPNVGPVNGLALPGTAGGAPDLVAQTDFNSSVNGVPVPEPGSLALAGLALGALGFAARRRRG